MTHPAPLSEPERVELIAYLDGELHGEAAAAVEARLARDPAARAEAESLKRTWELLDFLPQPAPSPSFAARTMSRLGPVALPAPRRRGRLVRVAGWAAAVVAAGLGGYFGYQWLSPREPGEAELVRDLRLIENKRHYDVIEEVEFIKGLEAADLFGDEGGVK